MPSNDWNAFDNRLKYAFQMLIDNHFTFKCNQWIKHLLIFINILKMIMTFKVTRVRDYVTFIFIIE